MPPCEPWSIVLVPRPLTPFAAFAWYAISELLPSGGLVRQKRFFRWIDGMHTRGKLFSPHGVILNLNADKGIIMQELLAWLKCQLQLVGVPPDSNSKSRALRSFIWEEKPKKRWDLLDLWFADHLDEVDDLQKALEISSAVFRKLVEEKIDPRKKDFDLPWDFERRPAPQPSLLDLPNIPGIHAMTIPIAKKRKQGASRRPHRQAVDYSIKHLPIKNIFRLCSEHILLAVGGPPNSGKSTLVASLFVEMRNILASLVSHEGPWKNLRLAIDVTNLDAATPVTDSVILRKGQRLAVTKAKREWTMALAAEAVEEAQAKLVTTNLLLADLPGKITEITEALSAPVRFGGIVTNDWSQIKEWRAYFDSVGVPVIFEARSSRAHSLVTTYVPGELLMGRIYQLNRVIRGWDPFVRTLAEFLLFDILPIRIDRTAEFLKSLFIKRREDKEATVRLEMP